MAQNPEAINQALNALIEPQARGRLLARGLARGMVWRDGVVPEGAQDFSANLTPDLLDFGYGILALALELRDANRQRDAERQFSTTEPFRVAAEAIESAVRRGDPLNGDQGRHLVMSAAAFHLAGFAARSFSMLPIPALAKNLASHERALAYILRRDLSLLREHIIQWHTDPAHSDDALAARLLNEDDDFGSEDLAILALTSSYYRGLGLADTGLLFGNREIFETAIRAIEGVVASAAAIGNIPTWWVATLTLHLIRDLWDQSLFVRLPSDSGSPLPARWNELRRDFIAQLATRRPPHIDLWPSQIAAAARAIDPNDDLVIALPTSAGKTRIAELCILRTLADDRRIIYVTPLRALSAQVERVLARTFVPLGAAVTSLYGASGATVADTKTLASASIVVATPEKLDFALRQDADVLNDVGLIVFDEGHMIGVGSREIRYEVLIQRLLRRGDAAGRRIVCLSAMFNPGDPYFKDFGDWLRSDAPGDPVNVQWRPTRQRVATLDWSARSNTGMLSFLDGEKPFVPRFVEQSEPRKQRKTPFPADELEFCICAANAFARDGHTVLVYSPQKSQVEPAAREFRHMRDQGYLPNVKPPQAEHLLIANAIGREWLGEKHAAVRALEAGVGTHHGALPRPFLNAVEELLDARRLSVVVASPTLAQGIDLACSVLIFRSLRRYEDGQWVPISAAEFSNVVGRSGRAYVDLDGISVLPTFDAAARTQQHGIFEKLIKDSKGQRLLSGLAQLTWNLGHHLAAKLGAKPADLLEYVLNQRDLWDDARLAATEAGDDEDEGEDGLEAQIANLDVALFSLIEPLDTDVARVAAILDTALQDSLWKRTLAREDEPTRTLERELLRSRAEWLWNKSTPEQRRACFYSGLGRKPGLFLHEQLDALVDVLCTFHGAVAADDGDVAAAAAAALYAEVMKEPFFAVRKLPSEWENVLGDWIKGTAFSAILQGRKARDAHRTQVFVQEGIVFRLVWAAEAVRVQAVATGHARADELGDGPAFALTYGTPSIPAALLCQMGFSSRVGATWVARKLDASFTDMSGLRDWLMQHDALLSTRDFWESDDLYALWRHAMSPTNAEHPRPWSHATYDAAVDWKSARPPVNSRVRIIAGVGRSATICSSDLTPLGTSQFPFEPHGAALDGSVISGGRVRVAYFGKA
ncbi:MAG TPA: DEAD/DEAH box helicase [Candidatus Acidoferrum sp.]|nr:DEAD/DEAH box helicase [Candidatus Acidoferrum sp.]